jgi:hypothetical protein
MQGEPIPFLALGGLFGWANRLLVGATLALALLAVGPSMFLIWINVPNGSWLLRLGASPPWHRGLLTRLVPRATQSGPNSLALPLSEEIPSPYNRPFPFHRLMLRSA